jgi:hypothetical protein
MRRRDFLRAAGSSFGVPAIASICTRTAWRAAMPSFDQAPDKPKSFGDKHGLQ